MNRPRLRWSATLAIVLAAASPSTRAVAQNAAEAAAIRAARIAQNKAIAARNSDSIASFWVSDVQITAGLGRILSGRNAYRNAFATDSGTTYERRTTEVTVSTHWPEAWEQGTWTGRANAGRGEPLISGRYAAQWVKVRGRWLIRSELFVALACSGRACNWPLASTH